MKRERLTEEVILETLEKHKKILKKYGVKRIGLFGSFVRGEQKKIVILIFWLNLN